MIVAEYDGVVFTAKELPRKMTLDAQCSQCEFYKLTSKECMDVCKKAVAAGMPDCDRLGPRGKPIIYIRTAKGDPRQTDLAGPVQQDPRQMALVR